MTNGGVRGRLLHDPCEASALLVAMIEIYAQSYNGQPASGDLRCVFGARRRHVRPRLGQPPPPARPRAPRVAGAGTRALGRRSLLDRQHVGRQPAVPQRRGARGQARAAADRRRRNPRRPLRPARSRGRRRRHRLPTPASGGASAADPGGHAAAGRPGPARPDQASFHRLSGRRRAPRRQPVRGPARRRPSRERVAPAPAALRVDPSPSPVMRPIRSTICWEALTPSSAAAPMSAPNARAFPQGAIPADFDPFAARPSAETARNTDDPLRDLANGGRRSRRGIAAPPPSLVDFAPKVTRDPLERGRHAEPRRSDAGGGSDGDVRTR